MNIFEELFDRNKIDIAYESYDEQLEDCQRMVDLYYYLIYMLQKESKSISEDVHFQMKGSVLLPTQMEQALRSNHKSQGKMNLNEEHVGYVLEAWEYLESRIPAQIENMPNVLYELFGYLYKESYQRICFLLGLTLKVDRKYERMSSFIQDNALEQIPTLSMAYGIVNLVEDVSLSQMLTFSREGFSWNLVFDTEYKGLATVLEMRECVLWRMMGKNKIDTAYEDVATIIESNAELLHEKLIIREEIIAQNVALFTVAITENTPTLSLLTGKKGAGKKYIAKQVAARVGKDILYLSMDHLVALGEYDRKRLIENLAATSILNGYIPIISYEQVEVDQFVYRRILDIFRKFEILFLFTINQESISINDSGDFLNFHHELNKLKKEEAENIWKYFAKTKGIHFDVNLDLLEVSSKYKLTIGQIIENLQVIHARKAEGFITERDIGSAIRDAQLGMSLKHCKKIQPFFTMEDLILPTEIKKMISHIILRIKKESLVNRQWGFEKKYAYGRGIGILLYGRPGTGKSMCAHVLANALELDLLKVDLSSVMSKYIGETEKNLTEVFDEAEKTNTILFFDEADSLFSQRSKDMGGANDKYANLETAHLLQKLEEFDGICVLTTNMAMNFDKAFFRRFEFMINIPYPDSITRLQLWEKAFPEECPRNQFIPLKLIAEQFELSPSEIKTIVRNAAFQAACNGENEVELKHIIEALRMDFNKNGKVMPILPFN